MRDTQRRAELLSTSGLADVSGKVADSHLAALLLKLAAEEVQLARETCISGLSTRHLEFNDPASLIAQRGPQPIQQLFHFGA